VLATITMATSSNKIVNYVPYDVPNVEKNAKTKLSRNEQLNNLKRLVE